MLLPLARLALRRPLPVLAFLAVATAAAAAGLFRLELRTDGAAIYPEGDPVVAASARDAAAFQEPEQLIVLATARPGGPLLASPAGFRFLLRAQAGLSRLPGLHEKGARSLVTLIEPPETADNLQILTYLETWDGRDETFPGLLARVRRMPLADGLFLSRDGTAAAFYLFLAPEASRREIVAGLERWIASQAAGTPFDLRVTGPAAAEAELGDEVLTDLARLVPLMAGAVALLLWLSLRTPGGVLIPLAQVLATLAWTLGLMGWCGVPVTLLTTILPVLLMALAMTDEIHLLERLQGRLAAIPPGRAGRQRDAVEAAFSDLQAPLILTSLTTASGVLSFAASPMAPLNQLGLFCCLGLLLALLFTFSLVPALLVALPVGLIERSRPEGAVPGGAARWERFLARRSRPLALAGLGLVLLALPGLPRLRVEDSWIDNFDPRSPLVTAAQRYDESFWGLYRLDIILTADEPWYFWTAEGMKLLEDVHALAEAAPHADGVVDVLLPYRAAARAYGLPEPLSRLPQRDRERTGMLVEILTLRIDLRHYLGLQAERARVRLFVPGAEYASGRELRSWLAARLPARLAGTRAQAHLSGDLPVGLAVVGTVVGNQLRSIAWTAVLIALALAVAFRDLRLTAVALAPVAAALLLLFGGMGYIGLPLGIATSLFAALTLGAGVDFALHFAYAWRREQAGRSHEETVLATLATAGRGLLWNALVLALGFSVLLASAIKPNASLGLLLAAAMLVSYAATLLLLPELLRKQKGMPGAGIP